jgi:2-polyprenyl-3-methyl-5-hydroxy-6-metoxy-1,4-benzoquinol methylase
LPIFIDVSKTAIEHNGSPSLVLLEQTNYLNIEEFDPFINKEQSFPPLHIKYNVILSINVLDVMHKRFERKTLIDEMWERVTPGGILFISTKTNLSIEKKAKERKWINYNDGFIGKDNLFYKGFSQLELEKLTLSLPNLVKHKSLNSLEFNSIILIKRTDIKEEPIWTLEDWEKLEAQYEKK